MIYSFPHTLLGQTIIIKMKNFRIFAKFLSMILLLFFSACLAKEEQTQVRIVDLQGRVKPVKTRLPELNAQALASQGFSTGTRDINQPVQNVGYRYSPNKDATTGDFGAASSRAMKQTLQPSTTRDSNKETADFAGEENPMVATNAGSGTRGEVVQYDLSEAKIEADEPMAVMASPAKKSSKKSAKKIAKAEVVTQETSKFGKNFFAQVGSFSSKANADATLAKMKKFHSGKVEVSEGESVVYRVWLGPITSRKQANLLIKKIKDSGSDAVLVRGR